MLDAGCWMLDIRCWIDFQADNSNPQFENASPENHKKNTMRVGPKET
jgi:hypothetical protein